MAFEWLNRLLRDRRPAVRKTTSASLGARRRLRPAFDSLEARCVPTVAQVGAYDGTDGNSPNAGNGSNNLLNPPDTQVAYGPTAILETYNLGISLTPKNGQFAPVTVDLTTVFVKQSITSTYNSPFSVYDDNAQRFIFGALETDLLTQQSWLHFAVSNTSTPTNVMTAGAAPDFAESQVYALTETGNAINGGLFAADPGIGFNADALVFTFNMESFANSQAYDHTYVLPIEKRTILDANPGTAFPVSLTVNANAVGGGFDRPSPNFGMVPARMHDAPAGAPMYFVGTYGQAGKTFTAFSSTALLVTTMTNYFTPNPGFITTQVIVPNYGSGTSSLNAPLGTGVITPQMTQPGNSGHGEDLQALDTQIASVAWQANHLVAAQTAQVNHQGTVAWYEIDTSQKQTAKLIQSGQIAPGPGVHTWAPAIDIARNLDIGIVYGESSTIEFPSMYAAGRTQNDPKGKLEASVRVKAGQSSLEGPVNTPIPIDLLTTGSVTETPPAGSQNKGTDPNFYFDDVTFGTYTYQPVHIIDRSGMDPGVFPLAAGVDTADDHGDDVTGAFPGTMWRSDPQVDIHTGAFLVTGSPAYQPVLNQELQFNFGQLILLNKVVIWNYNNDNPAHFIDPATGLLAAADPFVGTQFGARRINVFVEPSLNAPQNTWKQISTLQVAQATGASNPGGQGGQSFNLGNNVGQFVVFQFISNWTPQGSSMNGLGAGLWGTVGLSEVQFFKSPSPGDQVGKSSVQVDPLNPNTFVGASQYGKTLVPPALIENYGSWISLFRVSPAIAQTVLGTAPLRWVKNPLNGLFTGTYDVINNGNTITSTNGQLFITIVLPDASLVPNVPGATKVGKFLFVPLPGTFSKGQSVKITVAFTDPLKIPLPTGISNGTIFI